MIEIIAYGDGNIVAGVLDGIAGMIGSGGFSNLIKAAILIGFFLSVIEMMKTNSLLKSQASFLMIVTMTGSLMVAKTTTVKVVDLLEPSHTRVVSNVPYGLAILAGYTSEIGHGMTKFFESAMSIPGVQKYEKNGMLFGTNMMKDMVLFEIKDQELKRSVGDFGYQCIIQGVALGFVSWEELLNTDDIWNLARTRLNQKSRFFSWWEKDPATNKVTRSLITCANGVTKIGTEWNKAVNEAAEVYGSRMKPNIPKASAKVALLRDLPLVYNSLMGSSKSSMEIMRQSMLINAVQTGSAGAVKSRQAQEAFLHNRITITENLKAKGILDMAERKLPALFSSLLLLLYGAYPIIVCAMVIMGFRLLKTYAVSLLVLNMLPTYWAIMNYAFIFRERALAQSMGANLKYINQPEFVIAHQDLSATAALLSISAIPALMFLFKGVSAMGGLATSFAMNGVASAQQVGAEMASGNLSLGNTSFGTHNAWNTSMGQHDVGGRFNNLTSASDPYAGTHTTGFAGRAYGGSQNTGLYNLNAQDAYNERATEGRTMTETALASQNIAHMRNYGKDENFGTNFNETFQGSHSSSVTDALKASKSISDTYGIRQADVMAAAMNLKAGVGWGKVSAGLSGDFTTNSTRDEAMQQIKDFAESKDFSRVYSAMTSGQQSNTAGLTYNNSESYRKETGATYQAMEAYNKAMEKSEQESITSDENLRPAFQDWVMEKYGKTAGYLEQNPDKRNGWLKEFIPQYIDQHFDKLDEGFTNDIQAKHRANQENLEENTNGFTNKVMSALEIGTKATEEGVAFTLGVFHNKLNQGEDNILTSRDLLQDTWKDKKGQSQASVVYQGITGAGTDILEYFAPDPKTLPKGFGAQGDGADLSEHNNKIANNNNIIAETLDGVKIPDGFVETNKVEMPSDFRAMTAEQQQAWYDNLPEYKAEVSKAQQVRSDASGQAQSNDGTNNDNSGKTQQTPNESVGTGTPVGTNINLTEDQQAILSSTEGSQYTPPTQTSNTESGGTGANAVTGENQPDTTSGGTGTPVVTGGNQPNTTQTNSDNQQTESGNTETPVIHNRDGTFTQEHLAEQTHADLQGRIPEDFRYPQDWGDKTLDQQRADVSTHALAYSYPYDKAD